MNGKIYMIRNEVNGKRYIGRQSTLLKNSSSNLNEAGLNDER